MCNVSDGEGDAPSISIVGSFFKGNIFDCHGYERHKNFIYSKDFGNDICAVNVSCLAKERCIPSVANFDISTSQQFLERRGTLG
jgi:hypothetical protein